MVDLELAEFTNEISGVYAFLTKVDIPVHDIKLFVQTRDHCLKYPNFLLQNGDVVLLLITHDVKVDQLATLHLIQDVRRLHTIRAVLPSKAVCFDLRHNVLVKAKGGIVELIVV